ncbi:hypothetical protein [Paraburkholderia caribensis]|uniref:hypothetical protein n=1 Tax=Paraburkholderia caribensis TaxID=75105 RepID=UPI001D075FCA|nr:hypothetical protein [Paraburkholderia caribensis]
MSTLEPFREQIRDWHDVGVQGITIHHALRRNHGYTGSYSAVRRNLLGLRAKRAVPATTILELAPAEAAQIETWFFVMTLCW